MFGTALEAARQGNVGAMKFVDQKLLEAARAKAAREARGDTDSEDKAPARPGLVAKLGKKQLDVVKADQAKDADPLLNPLFKGLH